MHIHIHKELIYVAGVANNIAALKFTDIPSRRKATPQAACSLRAWIELLSETLCFCSAGSVSSSGKKKSGKKYVIGNINQSGHLFVNFVFPILCVCGLPFHELYSPAHPSFQMLKTNNNSQTTAAVRPKAICGRLAVSALAWRHALPPGCPAVGGRAPRQTEPRVTKEPNARTKLTILGSVLWFQLEHHQTLQSTPKRDPVISFVFFFSNVCSISSFVLLSQCLFSFSSFHFKAFICVRAKRTEIGERGKN